MVSRVGTILNAPRSRPTNLKTARECLSLADHDREPCPTLPALFRIHIARSLADGTLVRYLQVLAPAVPLDRPSGEEARKSWTLPP